MFVLQRDRERDEEDLSDFIDDDESLGSSFLDDDSTEDEEVSYSDDSASEKKQKFVDELYLLHVCVHAVCVCVCVYVCSWLPQILSEHVCMLVLVRVVITCSTNM